MSFKAGWFAALASACVIAEQPVQPDEGLPSPPMNRRRQRKADERQRHKEAGRTAVTVDQRVNW